MTIKSNSKTFVCVFGMSIVSSSAIAGGVDFNGQPITKLFEHGTFIEGTYSNFDLGGIKGKDFTGFDTGQAKADTSNLSLTFKRDVNDKLSFAIMKDQPFYAETSYQSGFFGGVVNESQTDGLTGLVRYKLNKNVAIHGGINATRNESKTTIPAGHPTLAGSPLAQVGYKINAKGDTGFGYIAGATYEIPKYFALVGLTYQSKISNTLDAVENGVNTGDMDAITPESVNLDFRFPVSKKDLVFGSVRWANWDGYNVTSPLGVNFADIKDNTTTYTLGAAHMFSPKLVGLVRGTYEKNPQDAQDINNFYGDIKSYGAGLSYTKKKTTVTGFVTRVNLEGKTGAIGTFDDGSATAVSLSIKQQF